MNILDYIPYGKENAILRLLCRSCNSSRGNRSGQSLVNLALANKKYDYIEERYSKFLDSIKLGDITTQDIEKIEEYCEHLHYKNLQILSSLKIAIIKRGEGVG